MMTTSTPTFTTLRAGCDLPVADLSAAPLPTEQTLRKRRSIPAQLLRFGSFNLRILRMVVAGRH